MTDRIRLVIADDQTLLRSGLARLLSEDPQLLVVRQAADGREAIKLAADLKPDVVIMDIRMPTVDGVEATRRILAEQPNIRVLVLTAFETDSYVLKALQAGASAYVLKDAQPAAIVSAIMAVVAGERVMASAVVNRVLDMLTGKGPTREVYENLFEREIEMLTFLATGLTNKQIAYRVHISEKPVRNHISNIYEKLKIYDRSQAVLYAVRKGLVEV